MRPPTANPVTQAMHGTYNAVDYSYLPDPTIYAPENGVISAYYPNAGASGNNLQLRVANRVHGFCHLERPLVAIGQQVAKGQPIGIMGWTGTVIPAGPGGRHLHAVLAIDGRYVYPPNYYNEPFIAPGGRGATDEMINTREEATVMYQMLRPNGTITEPELQGTVGRRSFAQFCRDAMPEITARNQALSAQAQHMHGLQATINQLNGKITELVELEAREDVEEAAKADRIKQLTYQVAILTDDLEKTTNRLNELSTNITHPSSTSSPAPTVAETPPVSHVEPSNTPHTASSVQSSPSWLTKLVADLVTLFVPKKT